MRSSAHFGNKVTLGIFRRKFSSSNNPKSSLIYQMRFNEIHCFCFLDNNLGLAEQELPILT